VTAGSSAISGWRVSWTYADGQTVTQHWNANLTSSGASVSATNVSWNGSLAAGTATTFGFLATLSGASRVPSLMCTPT